MKTPCTVRSDRTARSGGGLFFVFVVRVRAFIAVCAAAAAHLQACMAMTPTLITNATLHTVRSGANARTGRVVESQPLAGRCVIFTCVQRNEEQRNGTFRLISKQYNYASARARNTIYTYRDVKHRGQACNCRRASKLQVICYQPRRRFVWPMFCRRLITCVLVRSYV